MTAQEGKKYRKKLFERLSEETIESNPILHKRLLESYTEREKRDIWNKGKVIPGLPDDMWREDIAGRIMNYDDYGKQKKSDYSWEVDHIRPTSLGGPDELYNQQPLHWETNSAKSDTYPWHPGLLRS